MKKKVKTFGLSINLEWKKISSKYIEFIGEEFGRAAKRFLYKYYKIKSPEELKIQKYTKMLREKT